MAFTSTADQDEISGIDKKVEISLIYTDIVYEIRFHILIAMAYRVRYFTVHQFQKICLTSHFSVYPFVAQIKWENSLKADTFRLFYNL